MDFSSSTKAAETGQGGKRLLQFHLWYPDDPPTWTEVIRQNRIEDFLRKTSFNFEIRVTFGHGQRMTLTSDTHKASFI